MIRPALFALSLAVAPAMAPTALAADDFRDTLAAALEAYDDGDIQLALEELAIASRLLQEMRAESLESFLPPLPEGWSRTVDQDYGSALAMMGGGVGVDATYRGPDGDRVQVTITADSPMLGMFGAMFANPAMMGAMGGTVHRIGRERVLEQNEELTLVLAGRILIQMRGGDVDEMLGMFGAMDLAGLSRFDL